MFGAESKEVTANWLSPLRFGTGLALLVCAAFPQIVSGLETFVHRDFGYFGYPLAHHFRESFWRGEIPLWNPLNDCGIPFLAQWNTQVLYPPALFYLLFPLTWSLGVFCLLHLWMAGMGMFFLVERWTGNRFAAAVAGVLCAFNGLLLNSLMWPATIPGFGWMPWVVWLAERAWSDGGKLIVAAAIVGAMQMLSGAAEVIMMTWALIAALAVGDIVAGQTARLKSVIRLVAIVLLISGLCAAQLFPFFELLDHSNRQTNFNAAQWAMPVSGLGHFLVPLFHFENPYGGVFLQHDQYWTTSYYTGVTTLALAVIALIHGQGWKRWLLALTVASCVMLALGNATPLYKWVTQSIGVLSVMRFPVKFVILPMFLLPLLAGFGAARLCEAKAFTIRKTMFLLTLVFLMLIGGIVWIAWRTLHPQDNWTAMWQNAAVRAILFIAATGLLLFSNQVPRMQLRRVLQCAVLLVLWLDLITHMPMPETVKRRVYTLKIAREVSPPVYGQGRVMLTAGARRTLATSGVVDPMEDYLRRRYALHSDCNLMESIPKFDGFFPVYPREHMDIFWLLLGDAPPNPALMDFVGASMINSATNVFEWQRRTDFLPMVTGGQKPVFAADKETLRRLSANDFQPRQQVYLPAEAQGKVAVTNDSRVEIQVRNLKAHSIEVEIEAESPAMVVVAQTFYPAWKAYVDEKPVMIWRANHSFQAVEVPAGRHRLKLVYEDSKFRIGAAISLGTLALCILLLVIRSSKKRLLVPIRDT